jgi:hypothetical protein
MDATIHGERPSVLRVNRHGIDIHLSFQVFLSLAKAGGLDDPLGEGGRPASLHRLCPSGDDGAQSRSGCPALETKLCGRVELDAVPAQGPSGTRTGALVAYDRLGCHQLPGVRGVSQCPRRTIGLGVRAIGRHADPDVSVWRGLRDEDGEPHSGKHRLVSILGDLYIELPNCT